SSVEPPDSAPIPTIAASSSHFIYFLPQPAVTADNSTTAAHLLHASGMGFEICDLRCEMGDGRWEPDHIPHRISHIPHPTSPPNTQYHRLHHAIEATGIFFTRLRGGAPQQRFGPATLGNKLPGGETRGTRMTAGIVSMRERTQRSPWPGFLLRSWILLQLADLITTYYGLCRPN